MAVCTQGGCRRLKCCLIPLTPIARGGERGERKKKKSPSVFDHGTPDRSSPVHPGSQYSNDRGLCAVGLDLSYVEEGAFLYATGREGRGERWEEERCSLWGMFNHSSDLETGKASAFQHAMLKLFTGGGKKIFFFFERGFGGGGEARGRRGREESLNEHLHFVV